jgi:hypothetical protein
MEAVLARRVPDKRELLRRAELVAQAEEQAAIAAEQARTAEQANIGDLLAASVVATGLAQASLSQASAYERWAAQAEGEDRLLARSLRAVADALLVVSERAHDATAQANGYSALVDEELIDDL